MDGVNEERGEEKKRKRRDKLSQPREGFFLLAGGTKGV
jgi:hypothetical protein